MSRQFFPWTLFQSKRFHRIVTCAVPIIIIIAVAVSLFPQNVLATSLHLPGADFQHVHSVAPSVPDFANELLVIDINRPVTTADRGFPRNDPPMSAANGNWMSPVNFAEGTFHFRVHVRQQPSPQNMRIQFCIWQDNFHLENCAPMADVHGSAGTVVTWEKPVQELWMKNGKIIDWSRARQRYGFAIKNHQSKPVSDYNGWNWNGENPNRWYPLDAQMTVVVVAKGATFSGWHNYVDSAPAPTAAPTTQPTAQPTATPNPTIPPTAVPSTTPTETPTETPTATPTTTSPMPTPIPTTTAVAIDVYEPNDSCAQASPITTDTPRQEHTLHPATDVDWIRLAVEQGQTYRIQIDTEEQLIADLLAECGDNRSLLTMAKRTAPEMRIDYRAETSGTLRLKIEREERTSVGSTEYGLVVRAVGSAQAVELFLPIVLR